MKNCIFCKIAHKEIPMEFLYEDGQIIAFRDAHPIAPVHVLIIPKSHIPSVAEMDESDEQLAGKMIMVGKKLAEDLKIAKDGYKLLFRVRRHGGQEVDHAHLHLIGGALLSENIHPV